MFLNFYNYHLGTNVLFNFMQSYFTSPSLAIEETHRKLIASQYPMINLALYVPLFPRLLIDMFFIPINTSYLYNYLPQQFN